MHGTLPWNDKFKALLSAPYVMGIIVHDRRCWLEQFEPSRYQDPAVDRFTRERVKVEPDPALAGTAATVEVRMRDGKMLTDRRDCAKGDPDDPLSRSEIEQKLRIAAEGKLPAAQVDRIVSLVNRLEDLADVRELTAALRASS
jgi:2-methylcitrate dehydratase PrpD